MGFERTLEFKGETLTIMEWSTRFGIPFKTLISRLDSGWTAERALAKPVRNWRKHLDAEKAERDQYEKDDEKGHRKAFLDTEWGDQGAIL